MMKNPGYQVSVCQGRISSMVPKLLDGHQTGRMHSRFRTSLNLRFGNHLVYLDGGEHGLCCFGMAIDPREMEQILRCCGPGDLAVCRRDSLRLYGAGGVAQVRFSKFSCVDLMIPALSWNGQKPSGKSECFQILQERAESYCLGLEKDADFLHYSDILSGAGQRQGPDRMDEWKAAKAAVRFFTGRGQGLTPAGDDILTGYGAVLQGFGKAELFLQTLRENGLNTTDVSRAYLDAMTRGAANETFVRLLEQFEAGDPMLFQGSLRQLEQIGHTSGCDTLYGMYLGLKKMKEDT